MAGGINELIQRAAGSLAKDKISSMLTPNQLELASFLMSPQYYIAEKGVNKIADLLGYGTDYRQLKDDAKADKDYTKEIFRDAIGDVLPNPVGDFVRATPRVEEPYDPYNGYFAQNINDWVSTRQATPEEYDRFENTVRDMNYGTQIPGTGKSVGPLPEDNPMFEANVSNLPYDLKATPVSGTPDDFDPALLASIIRGDSANTTDTGAMGSLGDMAATGDKAPGGDFAPIDFGGTMDYSDVFGGSSGGSKLEDYAYSQYRQGGRVCSCHS
jgi:hypothetical protein